MLYSHLKLLQTWCLSRFAQTPHAYPRKTTSFLWFWLFYSSRNSGYRDGKTYRKQWKRQRKPMIRLQKNFRRGAIYCTDGYNMHWYFHVNLRSLQWLCELRSAPAGHPNYRFIAQELAKQVSKVFPSFERFFKFVDYDGYELGRLGQEMRIVEKRLARSAMSEKQGSVLGGMLLITGSCVGAGMLGLPMMTGLSGFSLL